MLRLSIIIPTFNSSQTIGQCLQSIAVQTFTDYEVIVQDGSPNGETASAIDRFLAGRPGFPVHLHREPDCGVYDAMNKAMARAQGEWLYFLGSDDELFDHNVLASALTTENTGNRDVIYGDVQPTGTQDEGTTLPLYDGKFELADILNRNICHQAIFYRAELARRVGEYNTDYPLLADWDFNLRCWVKTDFKYIGITVARYHVGGLSREDYRDKRFRQDFASNVMRYFNVSLLSPLVNAPGFNGFVEVVRMQREKGAFYAFCGRVVRRLVKLRLQLRIG
jgi:glycosyltransferase involved in cell wall biosynthesis